MADVKIDGDCFITAVELAIQMMGRDIKDVMVVHGLVTHPERNFRHIHAWVEVGDLVFDYSYKVGYVIDRTGYYLAGEIRPDEAAYYSVPSALKKMVDNQHYGPWSAELMAKETIPEEIAINCKRLSVE